LPGIFSVRTVPDAREIRQWLEKGTPFLAGMDQYLRGIDPDFTKEKKQ